MSLFSKSKSKASAARVSRFFGLDISDTSIKSVEIEVVNGKIALIGFGYTKIPNGIIAQGKIQSKSKLAELLQKVCKSAYPEQISSKAAILAFSDSLTYSYLFPGVTKPINKETIFKKASTLFPIDPKNLTCDWTLSPTSKKDILSAWVVATEFSNVKDYKEVLNTGGVSLEIIEPEAESLARLFAPKSNEPSLIVDIGARKTQIIVVQAKRVLFTRSVGVGGDHISYAISEALSVTPRDAEIIKRQAGLKKHPQYPKAAEVAARLVQESLFAHISNTITEMTQRGLLAPKQIAIIGGSSLLPGLKEYLAQTMSGIEILRSEPWGKIGVDYRSLIKKVRGFQPMTYSVAIGLALRGVMKSPYESGVNLIEHYSSHSETVAEPTESTKKDKAVEKKKKKGFWTLKLK